ncbi:MAG: hypothetical protein ACKVP7_09665 [Hyphomicrobiaceae bacterium]
MSITMLRGVLKRAAGLFEASGAKAQSRDIDAVEKLLADSGDATVDEFVERTLAARNPPKPAELSPVDVVNKLNEVGTDRAKFEQLVAQLKPPAFGKDKALMAASLFTGARPTAWKTKPQALEAIRQKFEERVYLAGKAALNEGVTPW